MCQNGSHEPCEEAGSPRTLDCDDQDEKEKEDFEVKEARNFGRRDPAEDEGDGGEEEGSAEQFILIIETSHAATA